MARTVRNPAWEPAFRRAVSTGLTLRAEAMAQDAQALAQGKSKRWASQIAATPGRITGPITWKADVGLVSFKAAFPGALKERGTKARTQKSTGRYTGIMDADPVFVPVAKRWASVPFTIPPF